MTNPQGWTATNFDIVDHFVETAFKNPCNAILYEHLTGCGLPNWVLVSGCLFQTVWNVQTGRSPAFGINDYDVFYFDDDTSWGAENRWIHQVADQTSDLGINVEVRNQARVHLWYEAKFGVPYPPLRGVFEGIDRFLHTSCAVGIYPGPACRPLVYAPFGLEDVFDMVLRANPLNPLDDRRQEKEHKWRALWPEIKVV